MSNSESKPRSMIHDEASASLPGLDALRVVSINHKTAPLEVLEGVGLSGDDAFAAFQGEAVYHDDVMDYSTNEPTMDGTASAVLLAALMAGGR